VGDTFTKELERQWTESKQYYTGHLIVWLLVSHLECQDTEQEGIYTASKDICITNDLWSGQRRDQDRRGASERGTRTHPGVVSDATDQIVFGDSFIYLFITLSAGLDPVTTTPTAYGQGNARLFTTPQMLQFTYVAAMNYLYPVCFNDAWLVIPLYSR
jgi:hypothetical protein